MNIIFISFPSIYRNRISLTFRSVGIERRAGRLAGMEGSYHHWGACPPRGKWGAHPTHQHLWVVFREVGEPLLEVNLLQDSEL